MRLLDYFSNTMVVQSSQNVEMFGEGLSFNKLQPHSTCYGGNLVYLLLLHFFYLMVRFFSNSDSPRPHCVGQQGGHTLVDLWEKRRTKLHLSF